MKLWKLLSSFVLVLAILFSVSGCKDDTEPPAEKTGKITNVFGYDEVAVIGDASISQDDFNAAVAKLQTVLTNNNSNITTSPQRDKHITMLSKPIIIKNNDNVPQKNTNGSLAIGILYIKANEAIPTIAMALIGIENEFVAKSLSKDNVRLADNGFKFIFVKA
jgi:hypothetical protein